MTVQIKPHQRAPRKNPKSESVRAEQAKLLTDQNTVRGRSSHVTHLAFMFLPETFLSISHVLIFSMLSTTL